MTWMKKVFMLPVLVVMISLVFSVRNKMSVISTISNELSYTSYGTEI